MRSEVLWRSARPMARAMKRKIPTSCIRGDGSIASEFDCACPISTNDFPRLNRVDTLPGAAQGHLLCPKEWPRKRDNALKLTKFSVTDHLKTLEKQIAYIEAALHEDDPSFIA